MTSESGSLTEEWKKQAQDHLNTLANYQHGISPTLNQEEGAALRIFVVNAEQDTAKIGYMVGIKADNGDTWLKVLQDKKLNGHPALQSALKLEIETREKEKVRKLPGNVLRDATNLGQSARRISAAGSGGTTTKSHTRETEVGAGPRKPGTQSTTL